MKKFLLFIAVALMTSLAMDAQDVKPLTDSNYTKLIGSSDNSNSHAKRPFVIDFTASWCGPCRMFAPVYDAAAKKYCDKIDFYKVDIDANKTLSYRFQIRAVPTIIFVNPEAGVQNVVTGSLDSETLEKELNQILK